MLTSRPALRLKNWVRRWTPGLLVLGSRVAARTVLFQDERAYLKGKRDTQTDLQSVLFFTTIRCASQYISGLISRLYVEAGGTPLDLPKYFFHGRPNAVSLIRKQDSAQTIFTTPGYFFGALRPILPEFDTTGYKVVVGVRDPRDVMVSFYYSLAYAHTPSNRKFSRDSKEAREKGLEWFVGQDERIDMVREILAHYRDHYWNKEGVFGWRYEDMMADFRSFLDKLARYVCGGNPMSDLCDRLAEEREESAADSENVLAHKRSGRSGQFREKLSPESADMLTSRFADILEAFGYER